MVPGMVSRATVGGGLMGISRNAAKAKEEPSKLSELEKLIFCDSDDDDGLG